MGVFDKPSACASRSGLAMTRTSTTNEDQYSEKESVQRRDSVIKRMLATPPKPHSEMKVGQSKTRGATENKPPKKRV
jgi:hypothetical protein